MRNGLWFYNKKLFLVVVYDKATNAELYSDTIYAPDWYAACSMVYDHYISMGHRSSENFQVDSVEIEEEKL